VMLVWRKGNIEKKRSLLYCIVCYHNGAQRYSLYVNGTVLVTLI